ncbi:MAG: threonine--tRNA ligase, partial [Rhodoluna sp.]|nr:threonine--tRNA ligase [Rhodoluna sp.]
MRVNEELKDLAHKLANGDVVEAVHISSPDGLNILRHSAAHVLGQAVQNINPEAKLGIGPPIKDGFYYDFDVETAFTPEDLKALEKAMERIIRSGQRFIRRVTTDGDARVELSNEPYKLELIGLKGSDLGEGSAE